jgi:hypothetical protein
VTLESIEQLVPMQPQKLKEFPYTTEALQDDLLLPRRATGGVQRAIVICMPPRTNGPRAHQITDRLIRRSQDCQ